MIRGSILVCSDAADANFWSRDPLEEDEGDGEEEEDEGPAPGDKIELLRVSDDAKDGLVEADDVLLGSETG